MLDQLVESKSSTQENTRRSGFLLTVTVIMVSVLLSAWLYSLFAKDYGMGGDELELSTLVAPVPVPEEEPPPEPEKQPEKQAEPNVDVRKELIQNIESTPIIPPDKPSVVKPNVQQMRLDRLTKLGATDSNTGTEVSPDVARAVTGGNTEGLGGSGTAPTGDPGAGAPPPPPPPKPTPKPVPKTVSGGVLNGKATSLPKPAYPAAARAVRAAGAVTVQVTIDENGRVISANATGGHPLLRAAAEGAARGARFSPTMLSGQPVKVTGIITYNFVP